MVKRTSRKRHVEERRARTYAKKETQGSNSIISKSQCSSHGPFLHIQLIILRHGTFNVIQSKDLNQDRTSLQIRMEKLAQKVEVKTRSQVDFCATQTVFGRRKAAPSVSIRSVDVTATVPIIPTVSLQGSLE